MVLICIGKRFVAESIKYEIAANTDYDSIIVLDYGYENKSDRLSMLEFNLNIGCSLNCTYCPQDKLINTYCEKYGKKKHLSYTEFQKIVDRQLNPCAVISFSGMSEPFENPDFVPMAEYAFEHGFRIFLNTTLMGMNEEKFLRISKVNFERIFLHIPDEKKNSKFQITKEYLDLLDRFIKRFRNIIGGYSCHSDKEDSRITNIISQFDIEMRAGTDNLNDRGGTLEILNQGFQHSGALICTAGETSVFAHVVMPNGEMALCCNDYKLEGNFGNLLKQDWKDICVQDGYRTYLKETEKCGSNYVCRRCVSARDKKWAIENLYPDYYYERNNYMKVMLQIKDYVNGRSRNGEHFFKRLAEAEHVCLFHLGNDKETNAYFDNGWNTLLKAECYSDFESNRSLGQIQGIRYVPFENIGSDTKWLIIVFSDNEEKIKTDLQKRGYNNYFCFCDFVKISDAGIC